MDPTRPKPDDDPFLIDDEEDEDAGPGALDWVDDPPATVPDPFEAVDDEEGTDLSVPDVADPTAAEPVSDEGGDDFDMPLPPGELDDRVRLPWQTEVMVVVRGKTLPATLDPTTPHSTWFGGPVEANGKEQVLWLDSLTLRVSLAIRPADDEHIVLGREAIAGKVLIEV